MCGIAGIFEASGRPASREHLLWMAGELAHRGPDGVGLYRDGPFGMINTRLAIVDLAGGDQPISNEDGRLWVMQNGEIYNHPELREELQRAGHRFTTTCDTEVIVHAYEEWGVDCLHRFNGAFAFALWDRDRRSLLLARDRFGVRPLFVAERAGSVLFGSEAKSILRHPKAGREIDPVAIVETLSHWVNSAARSAWRGIRELAPGHFMRVDAEGRSSEVCWWRLPFIGAEPVERPEAELAEELRALFLDAVRLRLRADVPVGAYLSGGLDSSATAAAVRYVSDCHLRSFSVRFDDPQFDEGPHQERMAAALNTELSSVRVDARRIAELLARVVWLAEKPLLRTAPAPLLALSGHVREHGFKVVLTGEGADEVFAGYHIFQEDKVRRFWARQPGSRLRPLLVARLHPYLARDLSRTGGFAAAFFRQGLTELNDPLYSHRLRFANTARLLQLLREDVLEEGLSAGSPDEQLRSSLPADYMRSSPLKRALHLEAATFLQGYLLHQQGDRMLMGNAVEGRFPFLDHRLAEFAAKVPDRVLLKGLREKHLLREAVAPLLPPEVTRRRKQPYRAPILRALVGPEAPEHCAALLEPASVSRCGVFSPAAVERLVAKCRAGVQGRGVSETDEMALVAVLSTSILHETFVAHPRLAPAAAPTREVTGAQLQTAEHDDGRARI